MNLKFSGVGKEPKKIALLVLLLVIAIYFIWPSGTPTDSGTSSATPARVRPGAGQTQEFQPVARTQARRRAGSGADDTGSLAEFRPSLRPKKGEELDRNNIDPTLRLDLLEKLQKVGVEGGTRSLFEYSKEPLQQLALVKEPAKIIPEHSWYGPKPPPPPPPPPPEPKAPPVPLKFYGFINPVKTSDKRAFFLDGEEIIVATEGQLVKNRYKIVRIGVNSAVVEDTQFKSSQNNQQTLPLVQEQTG